MRLIKARITNFRSAEDTGEFDIGQMTCLVGKNEAGKTAVLTALYGANPLGKFEYDKVNDYPRRYLTRYDERHEDGNAKIISTTWELSKSDKSAIEALFGAGVLSSDQVVVDKYYGGSSTWVMRIDEGKIVKFKLAKYSIIDGELAALEKKKTIKELLDGILELTDRSSGLVELKNEIESYRDKRVDLAVLDFLSKRLPKFFYTSHFDRMSGEISFQKLSQDKQNGREIDAGDQIFLDFLEYAGTSVEELQAATRLEELNAKCQAASNDITEEIFEFWSQNDALRVEISLAQGLPGDKPPLNAGIVSKIRIRNENHKVSVPLSERSAGFIWFFSFLSQFKQMRKRAPGAIILLDEPGLTLHGKAQADLLKYIIERLLPEHQVIYSTHSPFMVPAERLEDVRVVEDVVKKDNRGRPQVEGTKVSADVLSVDEDTLFPLQAHLGYEITQSLFIGANTLLVEGPSDILYLQAASNALKSMGREGLSSKWTMCPSGGIDKILSFASLFSGKGIQIAVLCDYGSGDKAKVQRLRTSEILRSEGILTASDFTGKDESDVEDFFSPGLFSKIVNGAYSLKGKLAITSSSITAKGGEIRQVKQVAALFNLMDSSIPEFDHFTPAAWLIRNQNVFDGDSDDVKETLVRFEKAFESINKLLDRK